VSFARPSISDDRPPGLLGAWADKEIVKEPAYDIKVLDRLVTRVAREVRLLEEALKATNAKTTIDSDDQDRCGIGRVVLRSELAVVGKLKGAISFCGTGGTQEAISLGANALWIVNPPSRHAA
jgi:hypothetical protein